MCNALVSCYHIISVMFIKKHVDLLYHYMSHQPHRPTYQGWNWKTYVFGKGFRFLDF